MTKKQKRSKLGSHQALGGTQNIKGAIRQKEARQHWFREKGKKGKIQKQHTKTHCTLHHLIAQHSLYGYKPLLPFNRSQQSPVQLCPLPSEKQL